MKVSAEQNDMRDGTCIEISFENDDHIQGKNKFLVEELALINVGSYPIFDQCFFQVLRIDLFQPSVKAQAWLSDR